MNKKILAFVRDGKKFLLLRNNSEDPAHGGDYWFTVTGSVEADEFKQAKRLIYLSRLFLGCKICYLNLSNNYYSCNSLLFSYE